MRPMMLETMSSREVLSFIISRIIIINLRTRSIRRSSRLWRRVRKADGSGVYRSAWSRSCSMISSRFILNKDG